MASGADQTGSSAPPEDSDIVLLPKRLRMEWTDALALDRELSHVAFRVACVIGQHFNRRSGITYLSQATISRLLGVSERTAWSGTKELEARGYVIVQRRELGSRTIIHPDGRVEKRRICGG